MPIIYRKAVKEDAENIKQYCSESHVDIPNGALKIVFIAENEDGEIQGLVALKSILLIEPLISKHIRVSQVLCEKALAVAGLMSEEAYALVEASQSAYINTLESYEFKVIDRSMTVLKKDT